MSAPIKTISRERGDTDRIRIPFTDRRTGQPIDFSNASVVLTVNTLEKPLDDSTQVFQLVGYPYGPATDGIIDFPLTDGQADNVGSFFYDIQMTTATVKDKTLLRGPFILKMDITKGLESKVWTPSIIPVDGASASVDGSENWAIYDTGAVDNTFQTRDSRRVIRDDPTSHWGERAWMPYGPEFLRQTFPLDVGKGWEWKITFYTVEGYVHLATSDVLIWTDMTVSLDATSGVAVDLSATNAYLWDNNLSVGGVFTLPSTAGWPTTGWYVLGIRIKADRTIEFEIRPEANAADWRPVTGGTWHPSLGHVVGPHPKVNTGPVFDVAQYEWRVLT